MWGIVFGFGVRRRILPNAIVRVVLNLPIFTDKMPSAGVRIVFGFGVRWCVLPNAIVRIILASPVIPNQFPFGRVRVVFCSPITTINPIDQPPNSVFYETFPYRPPSAASRKKRIVVRVAERLKVRGTATPALPFSLTGRR